MLEFTITLQYFIECVYHMMTHINWSRIEILDMIEILRT